MSNSESSKTLSGVAAALMVGYYLFGVQALLHAVAVLLFLVAFPNRLSRTLAGFWLRFGKALGAINSKILLALIYFLVLVPVSFCYRRFNPKTVRYFEGRGLDTLFVESTGFPPESFEKTW